LPCIKLKLEIKQANKVANLLANNPTHLLRLIINENTDRIDRYNYAYFLIVFLSEHTKQG
tara:strand:+ start:155 stop:334 length:180 start_codon:yes stop_codon:yes gene_type:complete